LLLPPHQAKYIAHDLTLQHAGGGLERLSQTFFNACVDLNPHQIEAAVFALRLPQSKGVLTGSHEHKDLSRKNRHQSKHHAKNTLQQPLAAVTDLVLTDTRSAGSEHHQWPQINQAKQLRCFCPASFKRWRICAPCTKGTP
jgi:hypothetical protein